MGVTDPISLKLHACIRKELPPSFVKFFIYSKQKNLSYRQANDSEFVQRQEHGAPHFC